MELQRTRLFLVLSLFIIGVMLFIEWQREHTISTPKTALTHESAKELATDVPTISANVPAAISANAPLRSASLIDVTTDVYKIKIDPQGGDIVRAELLKYPESLKDKDQGEILLSDTPNREFIAQTGLIGKDGQGPDSRQLGRAHYSVKQSAYQLGDKDTLAVDLDWENEKGLKITKTLLFKKGSYVVDVIYQITNNSAEPWQGSFYGQLRRKYEKKSGGMLGVQMYEGGGLYTPDKPYKKVSFSDMKKNSLRLEVEGGWAALLDHYFLAAFIPSKDSFNNYYTRVDNGDIYNIGATTAIDVPAGQQQTVQGKLYIGPEIAPVLKEISPGLNLTIDYGILWPISAALFWLLKNIHALVGNWGWAIIFVTLIIKVLFYQLSASSYRSMGQMRTLTPKIEALKKRHGDDKQQFSAALMDLYKKEKINPLGGCLPILIQIPVFIALYYVLLESIELRQAPFMLWIQDLSAKDPYYILPLIMGATMFLQQKMNPAPPDPMQAKVMMFMPVVFTVLFLSFPSGLVLYWTVNNLLSIAQQWYITRTLEREAAAKKAK